MGYTAEIFVVDLMYGFFFNLIFVVFAVIAGLRAEQNKKPWGFFMVGIIIQSFADIGLLISVSRNAYINSANLSALIFTVICFVSGYLIVRKTHRQAKKEFDTATKKDSPENIE